MATVMAITPQRYPMSVIAEKAAEHPQPALAQITDVFVRHGNFTLGGGSATTVVLRQEIVDRRQWIRLDQFTMCFALARLMPGTNLLALTTGLGWLLRGLPGALAALLAGSIPCSLMAIGATALFSVWQGNPWAQAAIQGAVAAAVAVTVRSCWTIAHPYVQQGRRLRVALIAGAAFLLNVAAGLSPIEVLVVAGVIGAVLPPSAA